MRVDVERVKALQAEIDRINATPLEKLEIYENGERVEMAQGAILFWKYTGLTNWWFLRDEAWKGGVQEGPEDSE